MQIVVIGHNSPDIDCIASAIVEADRLNKKGQEARPFIAKGKLVKSVKEILKFCNIDLPKKWQKDLINNPTILVDYNDLNHGVERLNNIIEVIDHHTEADWIKSFKPKTIDKLGATATLVAERYLKEFELSSNLAKLLLFAIVSDTKSFSSSKTTNKDIEMAKKLEPLAQINIKKINKLIKRWSNYRFNKKHITRYLKSDIKRSYLNNKLSANAEIIVNNYKPFLKHYKLIEKEFDVMISAEVKLIAIYDNKRNKTVLIHNKVLNLQSPYLINNVINRREVKNIIRKYT